MEVCAPQNVTMELCLLASFLRSHLKTDAPKLALFLPSTGNRAMENLSGEANGIGNIMREFKPKFSCACMCVFGKEGFYVKSNPLHLAVYKRFGFSSSYRPMGGFSQTSFLLPGAGGGGGAVLSNKSSFLSALQK